MPRPYNQGCPIARSLDIFGDRWTMLIIRDLFLGSSRFQQLLRSSPGLPPRLLSDRLKKLEQHGLVERSLYSQHPLRAEYRLTEKGRSLAPVLDAIGEGSIGPAWTVDEVVLYGSRLSSAGARYTPLARVPLTAGA